MVLTPIVAFTLTVTVTVTCPITVTHLQLQLHLWCSCEVMCHVQGHVKREKEIQAECNSPFMVNLLASFKDQAYLYMLLECIMGGELFTYLQVSCVNKRFSLVGHQGSKRVCAECQ